MTLSLKDLKFHLINDKRIIKCIMGFLYFFYEKIFSRI